MCFEKYAQNWQKKTLLNPKYRGAEMCAVDSGKGINIHLKNWSLSITKDFFSKMIRDNKKVHVLQNNVCDSIW